jgi:eukaryotic-like serine/threonine-protein kinase
MRTAEEIVAAALEIAPPEERQSFVERVCANDAHLRSRVDTLLNTQIETVVLTEPSAGIAVPRGEGPGSLIGPYKLMRPVGAGGMGMVWIAAQEYPIRREVAVKIIKPGMDSGEIIARFEAERQALAMMDHPNIAKVLDAGTTSSGRPYFAMELVQGVPITEYCDANRLGPRERLELLVPVCRAIQHAHQKGIIHRDIKPSNILVSSYDGQPTPKVIDFGIAKATGPSLTEGRLQTQFGAVVGTLQYMSPEQAETGGADIDTRSDVYSLGVVMYELLTGRTPLDWGGTNKASYVEVLRRIREEEPPVPSTRLAKSRETLAEVAALRGVEARKLPQLLRGELDWIVLKALEKDRTRRYETPSDLARDIERYLNGEPVQASPLTATYRARKFARRHRLLLATAAGFLALLIAGVVASTLEAVRARRAEQAAKADRDNAVVQMHRADTEAETARVVNEFLQNDLLGQASSYNQAPPDQKPDPDLKVRTALDRAAAKIEGAFKNRPLVEASIRQTIGSAYTELGLYKEAGTQLEQAVKLRSNQPSDDRDTLEAQGALATLYAAQGNVSAALPLVQDVLKIRQRKLGPEHPETLDAMNNVAALLFYQGNFEEAEAMLRKALKGQAKTLGPLHPDTLQAQTNLADTLRFEGKLSEAEALERSGVEGYRKSLGPDHPNTLHAESELAALLLDEGKYPEAEAALRQTLAKNVRVLGTEHPDTALALDSLAGALRGQKRFTEAEELYRRALAVRGKVLGAAHPLTLRTKLSLALLYQDERKYAEAEAGYAGVIRLGRQSGGADPDLDAELAGLGAVRLELGKFAEAEPVLRESLELRKKKDPNGYRRYNAESALGASLGGQGKYSEAEPFLLGGYEGMRQLGDKLPESGKARFKRAGERIVQLYESWGKPEKAAAWREKLKGDASYQKVQ